MDKHIHILAAHLDDIEISLFGYLQREIKEADIGEYKLYINTYICSAGLAKDGYISQRRGEVYIENLESIFDCKSNDEEEDTLFLKDNKEDSPDLINGNCVIEAYEIDLLFHDNISSIKKECETFISNGYSYSEDSINVLIYNSLDIHTDHQVVKNIGDVIARPSSQGGMYHWDEVRNFVIPSNEYSQYGIGPIPQNSGNYFLTLTKKEKEIKRKCINRYFEIGVLKEKVSLKELSTEKQNIIYIQE